MKNPPTPRPALFAALAHVLLRNIPRAHNSRVLWRGATFAAFGV